MSISAPLPEIQLSQLAPFADLDASLLSEIEAQSTIVHLGPGQTLFRQSDPGDALYVIITGHVQVLIEPANGPAHVLAEMLPGDYLGEMALLHLSGNELLVHCAWKIRSQSPEQLMVQLLSVAHQARLHHRSGMRGNLTRRMAVHDRQDFVRHGCIGLKRARSRKYDFRPEVVYQAAGHCVGNHAEHRRTEPQVASLARGGDEALNRANGDQDEMRHQPALAVRACKRTSLQSARRVT